MEYEQWLEILSAINEQSQVNVIEKIKERLNTYQEEYQKWEGAGFGLNHRFEVEGSRLALLHLAAIHDRIDVVNALIKGGADINALDSRGYIPLCWAVEKGHKNIAEVLIEKILIQNSSAQKPDYLTSTFSTYWDRCKELVSMTEDVTDSKKEPEQVSSGAGIDKELLRKLQVKSNTQQGQSEIDGSFDDQYDLIIEYLSQIPPSNNRLEILRKQGHSQSDIDEMFGQDGSWYTQSTRSYNSLPSLMDSKYSMSEKMSVWSVLDHNLTKSQKKLNIELLNVLKYLEWHDEGALFNYDNGQVDKLEEFLKNNRGNPDLKAILNVKSGESGSTILHAIAGARIGDQENRAINLLLEAGADPNIKNDKGETSLHRASAVGYGENAKSGVLWGNIIPDQKEKLSEFLDILSEVKDINQLEKSVKVAIKSGVRLNYRFTIPSPFEGYSFTDYVIKRISELEKNPKVASGIICQLVSKGAVFGSPESIDVIDELGLECKDHKANMIKAFEGYINDAHRFIKVAKSATTSKLNDIAIGNTILYLEYSEDSKIDIAKITDGARSLWLTHENAGYERNIVKIGESEVEIITQNGKRHYTDLIGNIVSIFSYTNSEGKLEELEVNLYSNKHGRIKVEVSNKKEVLEKFKNCKEELGKNCLFGVHSVYDAIERGYFEKPAPSSRIVQEEKLQSGKKVSWADQVQRTRGNEASIEL